MATNNQLLNCPPLRFPDFSMPWKQTTLGEVLICHSSNLREGDIQLNGSIPIWGASGSLGYAEVDNFLTESILIIKDGSGVGRVQYINENHYFLATLNSLKSISPIVHQKYIYYFLCQFDFRQYISGSGIPHIYFKDYAKSFVSLPSLAEQKKIASFLSLIDERIEAQRQTIEERKKQKKALLHQLFSQSLRFPEFSEPWTQTTLGEVCQTSTGVMNTQDKIEGGEYPFYIRSSKIERANRFTYDGIAILTPGDGAIGQIFHYSEGKIAVHQRVYMLTEIQCVPKYLFHYFSARFFERVIRMSAKNTVDSVRMNMITDMPISLPSLTEQERIAELFTTIDERIEVEEQLLVKYEEQKKYLLRQMFV